MLHELLKKLAPQQPFPTSARWRASRRCRHTPRLERLEDRLLLSAGDFNGDGYDDLAIGVPLEDLRETSSSPTIEDAGAVNVVYGSAVGLTASDQGANGGRNDQLWSQRDLSRTDGIQTNDQFGYALAVGDFDGNGYDDLAIGAPSEDFDGIYGAGEVNIVYGSESGLRASYSASVDGSRDHQVWRQGENGLANKAETNDLFGMSLVAGDFNGDGYDDLVVAAPYEDLALNEDDAFFVDAGAINVLEGSANGLTATDQFIYQGKSGLGGMPENSDHFGLVLAAGNFNGDRNPFVTDFPSVPSLAASADPGKARTDAMDGRSIEEPGLGGRAGDVLIGRPIDDLAIGVPHEDVVTNGSIRVDAGVVQVINGSLSGLNLSRNQTFHQGRSDLWGKAEKDDYFGAALAAGDFDGGGKDDLAIGVPGENLASPYTVDGLSAEDVLPDDYYNVGVVNIVYADEDTAGAGLDPTSSEVVHQYREDLSGLQQWAEGYDYFGTALAAADFGYDEADDLAIGVHEENLYLSSSGENYLDAGMVNVIYGEQDSGLSDSLMQTLHQNVAGIDYFMRAGEHFGAALAAGDFDGKGRADLAVGVPEENQHDGNSSYEPIHYETDSGAVNVIYSTATNGLNPQNSDHWTQDRLKSSEEAFDDFGMVLCSNAIIATHWNDPVDLMTAYVPTSATTSSLRMDYGFYSTGNHYENWAGMNEKWFPDRQGDWYAMTPDGQIRLWNKEALSTSEVIAQVDPAVFKDLDSLFNAEINWSEDESDQLSDLRRQHGFHFGGAYYENWSGMGEKWFQDRHSNWHTITPDGQIRQWNGGALETSAVVASVPSVIFDDPGLLFEAKARFTETESTQLTDLKTAYGFHSIGNYYENWSSMGEKWFQDRHSNWYAVTPDGQIREWNGGDLESSKVIAEVTSLIFDDPRLLFHARIQTSIQERTNLANIQAEHGFRFVESYYESADGLGEKWFQDRNDEWFAITSDGKIRRWNGYDLATSLIITEVAEYLYDDPSLLFAAGLQAT